MSYLNSTYLYEDTDGTLYLVDEFGDGFCGLERVTHRNPSVALKEIFDFASEDTDDWTIDKVEGVDPEGSHKGIKLIASLEQGEIRIYLENLACEGRVHFGLA